MLVNGDAWLKLLFSVHDCITVHFDLMTWVYCNDTSHFG